MITDWHSILVNSDKLAGKKCPGLGMTIMYHTLMRLPDFICRLGFCITVVRSVSVGEFETLDVDHYSSRKKGIRLRRTKSSGDCSGSRGLVACSPPASGGIF